jgi:hypothetical protein
LISGAAMAVGASPRESIAGPAYCAKIGSANPSNASRRTNFKSSLLISSGNPRWSIQSVTLPPKPVKLTGYPMDDDGLLTKEDRTRDGKDGAVWNFTGPATMPVPRREEAETAGNAVIM